MHVRLLALIACLFVVVGCSSTPDNDNGSEETAATEEGLSDEPMGDEASGEEAAEGEAPAAKSLFDRIGGKSVLEDFANNLVDAVAKNAELTKNPAIKKALEGDQSEHKKQIAEFFCAQSGGPCTYNGPDARAVYGPMNVTKAEWNVFRKVFIRTLKNMNVKKQERMDLAMIAARQKKNIVTK